MGFVSSSFNGLYVGNACRDWRQAGGNQAARLSASQPVHSLLPSPTVSASRKKQKTSQSVTSLAIAVQPQVLKPLILVVLCMLLSSLNAN